MEEESVTINSNGYAKSHLERLNALRKDGVFCDFVIEIGGEKLPVHKNVLAANSDYFRAMLSHDTKENLNGFVNIMEVDFEAAKECVNFIYTGRVIIPKSKQEDLLYVAHMFQLHELCDCIGSIFESDLNPRSFFPIRKLADVYSCNELADACDQFALENITEIAEEEEFGFLEKDYLVYLLQSQNVVCSEAAKCKILIEWVKDKYENRKLWFSSIFEGLKVSRLPLGYRRYLAEKEPLVYKSSKCLKLLMMSVMNSVNVNSAALSCSNSQDENMIVVCDKVSHVLRRYEPDRNEWAVMHCLHSLVSSRSYRVVLMENELYFIVEGNAFFRFSFANYMVSPWTRLPDRTLNCMSAAECNGQIYTIGSNGNGEKFNPATKSWDRLPSQTKQTSNPTAVSCYSCVYSIGGRNSSCCAVNAVERFDPISNSWTEVPAMNKARYDSSAVIKDDRIYVLGGRNNNSAMSDVEYYDLLSNIWVSYVPMVCCHSDIAACYFNGKIYVFGDETNGRQSQYEMFDFAVEKWEIVKSVGTPMKVQSNSAFAILL